jgi:hypothetical protein
MMLLLREEVENGYRAIAPLTDIIFSNESTGLRL